METKKINDLINSIISSEEFEKLQDQVSQQIYEKVKTFPFESDDDVRLVMIRVKDQFVSGFNYKTARMLFSLMGIKEK